MKAETIAKVPGWLRNAKDKGGLTVFEDKVVSEILKHFQPEVTLAQVRTEASRICDHKLATLNAFHSLCPEFGPRLTVGRFRFHYDGLAIDLLNDPIKTPIWSAFCDSLEADPSISGLVFPWLRIKKSRGLCVFHRIDPDLMLRPRSSFRLLLGIKDATFTVEPLPGFIYGYTEH